MKTLLSTKILNPSQRTLLLNAGIGLVEYDAIRVRFLDVHYPESVEYAIITSQNAAKFIIENKIKVSECYCVGKKTASLLTENGQKVIKTTENANELANFIVKSSKKHIFTYFCGTRRLEELPSILESGKVPLHEIVCYETLLQNKVFKQEWDGILFFSPSGVESFLVSNELGNSISFCIGDTTASTIKKYTGNLVVANSATVESVIAKAVKTLTIHD